MNLDSISQELDRLYEFEISKYIERCEEIKKSGLKVYRNSQGKHKVVISGNGSQNMNDHHNRYDSGNVKKENILIRTRKKIKRSIENIKAIIRFIKILHENQKY